MRTCKICGKGPLLEGYCIDDGFCYYCSADCLGHDYTPKEWDEAYNDGWGYWTEWDDNNE